MSGIANNSQGSAGLAEDALEQLASRLEALSLDSNSPDADEQPIEIHSTSSSSAVQRDEVRTPSISNGNFSTQDIFPVGPPSPQQSVEGQRDAVSTEHVFPSESVGGSSKKTGQIGESKLDLVAGRPCGISTNSGSLEPQQSVSNGHRVMIDHYEHGRDEPWRPQEPVSLAQGGVNETLLEAIVYRFLLSIGEATGREIADQVALPFQLIQPLLNRLKMEQHVAYKSATSTNDYIYVLTDEGRRLARGHQQDCSYFGACPVPLEQYVESVREQSMDGQYPKKKDLEHAFEDLLINPGMFNRLGPAIASGKGMFLFGYPGNGKTSIAERVTKAFGQYIWVPKAIEIAGEVIRLWDPMCHVLEMPQSSAGLYDCSGFDKRWVRIQRPTIVAGGELTMEMLEVQHNPETNVSEAPLQLKSNCGTLVIDDFGRQKMRVDELLNRWIVPLEKRYDFLNLASGKKMQVPFDQMVVFSTNLEPKDLVDDAFLRRIPYKIEAENPPESDFRQLFEIMCGVVGVPYRDSAVDYLIEHHYVPHQRAMRMCHPRDLLLQVKHYCLYHDVPIELKDEYLDFACQNYFSVL